MMTFVFPHPYSVNVLDRAVESAHGDIEAHPDAALAIARRVAAGRDDRACDGSGAPIVLPAGPIYRPVSRGTVGSRGGGGTIWSASIPLSATSAVRCWPPPCR